MKGFIELNRLDQFRCLVSINIDTIAYFSDGLIVQNYSDCSPRTVVEESYEQIKQLIKEAQ